MKIIIINKSDETGGAAIVSRRLMDALRDKGVDARMLVVEKRTDSPFIERAASAAAIRRAFMAERLRIFMANGMNRADLFKVDTASDGLDLYRHRWVREADVICLNWVNQGMVSLSGLRHLLRLGKPVVWTMHDLWCMTGICHHPGDCLGFTRECGYCPFLGRAKGPADISHSVWKSKKAIYSEEPPIHFVAVSRWLAQKASGSSLLREAAVSVIPNAFPVESFREGSGSTDGKFRIVTGAARLDDPVKGLPFLLEAMRILKEKHPELAQRTELITFGTFKNPDAMKGVAVSHKHLGRVSGTEALSEIYGNADCVLSTSLYETLPGTLIEGQACGAFPVSFNRGGQADIIEHGTTGWLAEFPDCESDIRLGAERIAEGLAKAALRSPRQRGILREEVIKKFSAESVADRYIALFDSLLSTQ